VSSSFPSWLSAGALEPDELWSEGTQTQLSEFFREYSLHDSEWLSVSLDPRYDGDGVAAFKLDTFWFREQSPALYEARWAALLVKFRRVRGLKLLGFEEDSPGPRTIASAVIEPLGADAVLVIEDIFGGRMEITHRPDVILLCRDWEGHQLPLPLVAAS